MLEPDRGREARRPGEIPVRGWKDVGARVRSDLRDDHVPLAAAGVAFFGFLALVPAIAAVVSVYGLVGDPDEVEARVQDVASAAPQEVQDLLVSQMRDVVDQSGSQLTLSLVVSIVLALWSASSGMSHLVEAVNIAYDEDEGRGMVRRRLLALALTLGAVLFVVVAVGALAILPAALAQTGLDGWARWLLNLAVWPVLAAGFALALSVLYRYGPDREEPRWRWVTPGSVVAVVAWVVASLLFQVYAANFGSYGETYGSLAAIVVLLLWLFLTAFAVLLGAEVNAELEHQTVRDSTTGAPRPMGDRDAHVADTLGRTRDERRS